jgi:preprotein translocase subunit SecF
MMQIIKNTVHIPFTRMFPVCAIASTLLCLIALGTVIRGLNYGVDFRGGAEIQVKFKQDVNLEELRRSLVERGYSGGSVQSIGEASDYEYLIRLRADEKDLARVADEVGLLFQDKFKAQGAEIRKVDVVGPKAGEQLRLGALQALLFAFIGILVYISLRFNFKFAPGAVIALVHDTLIVIGVFGIFQIEFTLQTVAALLAIVGYSVNDTVIVYDRIREHEELYPGRTLAANIDNAINQTLSRTILTSGATLIVTIVMWIWGGEAIKDFFMAMTVGILIGTYSSVFIASPFTLLMDKGTGKVKA